MSTVVLTPLHASRAVELAGGLWRKRVLPVGDVPWRGKLLHFTRPYLDTLVSAFRSHAYDSIPFQLAGPDGAHTLDPERTRGEVVDVDADDDGLWITARLTPDGERTLAANPGLGAACRIVEDYRRSDGEHYTAALQSVLGTHTPHIGQLGPWQAVEAANTEDQVIDLSGGFWADAYDGATAADLATLDAVLLELAEEGPDADGETGRPSPDDDEAPDDVHSHGHQHVHDDGTSHAHAHDHLHDESAHDEPGQTSNFANSAEDHVHAHEHSHMGAGHHGHPHAHDHESAQHMSLHANIGPSDYGAGGDAGQLASMNAAIELAAATERARTAQHAGRPSRMAGEARLADALARIGTGTYTPSRAAQVLGFAGDAASSAGRALAQQRWAEPVQADPGICGPPDAIGGCSSRYHDATCSTGMLADPEVAQVLAEEGVFTDAARSPWADGNGRVWFNQAACRWTSASTSRRPPASGSPRCTGKAACLRTAPASVR